MTWLWTQKSAVEPKAGEKKNNCWEGIPNPIEPAGSRHSSQARGNQIIAQMGYGLSGTQHWGMFQVFQSRKRLQ